MTTAVLEPARTSALLPVGCRVQSRLRVGTVDDPLEREADAVAERVVRMPDPAPALISGAGSGRRVQRCPGGCPPGGCRDDELHRQALTPTGTTAGPPTHEGGLVTHDGADGQPLPLAERRFFEPRLGADLSSVRLHVDQRASELAHAVDARAFTLGSDVFFAADQWRPSTGDGRRLLAHELAHVLQQDATDTGPQHSGMVLQRAASTCSTDWRTTVSDDHDRAMSMIDTARTKLSAYDGTSPPEVRTALDTHFKASSTGFGAWVNLNLGFLRLTAGLASYDCEDTSSWWCRGGNTAKTFWCVPFVDIRVCQPAYFSQSDPERSETLIHEWVHKYGCNFDLGYSSEPDYPSQWTLTALLNADPWSEFVQDVQ